MAVSIRELARLAGVSPTTVSNAIRGNKKVSEETRIRIQALAKKLNYKHNKVALGMFEGKTYSVGIIVADIDCEFYPPIIRGVEDCAIENGYTVMTGNSLNDVDRERTLIHMFLERRVDGLLVAPAYDLADESNYREVQKFQVPMVVVDRRLEYLDTDFVGCDDAAGAALVVDHLVSLGHRNIGYVGGLPHIWTMKRRKAGLIEALENHGLRLDPDFVIECQLPDFVRYSDPVREPLKRLFSSDHRPTALFGANEFLAVGCCEVLRELGFRVPEDVSVTGFGGVNITQYVTPKITTVVQPKRELGMAAMEILLKRMEERSNGVVATEYVTRTLDVSLDVRESTGPVSTRIS